MKTSTEINSAAKLVGEEMAIEYCAKVGFDAWDFSMFSMCEYDWLKHCLKDNNHPLAGNDYLAFAKKLKRIGLDNIAHVDVVNDQFFTACLDIGHAEMRGSNTSAVEMILSLENRITALHIHDNDKWHDLHQIPFSAEIDFAEVVKALKKIEYKGFLTLEADSFLKSYTKENVFAGMEKLASAARKLADMLEL